MTVSHRAWPERGRKGDSMSEADVDMGLHRKGEAPRKWGSTFQGIRVNTSMHEEGHTK